MFLLGRFVHPSGHGFPHPLLEGEAEGAVAAVVAFVGELLGREELPGSSSLATEIHEMVEAERRIFQDDRQHFPLLFDHREKNQWIEIIDYLREADYLEHTDGLGYCQVNRISYLCTIKPISP